jgi:uncharacterized Zn-binding protein involved in type VI secretion
MAALARSDGIDTVDSIDGISTALKPCCADKSQQFTDEGSLNVFVNGAGVVREGDAMIIHPFPFPPCCGEHAPTLNTFSPSVLANGLSMGRKGDDYGNPVPEHIISSGSSNVFANGA